MAVEAASFKIVTLATRSRLKFMIASNVVSKPSRINSGWFGSVPYSSLNPAMEVFPRISISGKRFGSEPHSLLSITKSDGSSVFKLWMMFWLPTCFNSLLV